MDKARSINPQLNGISSLYSDIEQRIANIDKADSLFYVAQYRFNRKRFRSAKKFIMEALNLYPLLEGGEQLLAEINAQLKLQEQAPQIAIDIVRNDPDVIKCINKLNINGELSWSSLASPAVPGDYEVTASSPDKIYILQWLVNPKSEKIFPLNVQTKLLIQHDNE